MIASSSAAALPSHKSSLKLQPRGLRAHHSMQYSWSHAGLYTISVISISSYGWVGADAYSIIPLASAC
ncbi:hypothetical protein BDR04DRAFT_1089907 [Suillus decipiens]|nr:hypothetical protein BDR04DRAFT_1089907 [Suillus decipiens]